MKHYTTDRARGFVYVIFNKVDRDSVIAMLTKHSYKFTVDGARIECDSRCSTDMWRVECSALAYNYDPLQRTTEEIMQMFDDVLREGSYTY